MDVDLAVVIVTYNSEHVIDDLLDSLPAALGRLTADVVIVDNDSSDGTRAIVERRQDCTLVRSSNRGYAAGINLGNDAARPSQATLVLNPDVRLMPGSAAKLFDAVRPGVGIVAPQVRGDDGRLHRSLRREPTLLRSLGLTRTGWKVLSEYVGDQQDYLSSTTVDWALGAVLLVTAECAAAVGPWDESFFLYSEETDLCARSRDRGFCVLYEPSAVVVHIGAQSGTNDEIHAMQIINRVRYYTRRHGIVASSAYYVLAVINELGRFRHGRRHRHAVATLLRPRQRPPELGCGVSVLPR